MAEPFNVLELVSSASACADKDLSLKSPLLLGNQYGSIWRKQWICQRADSARGVSILIDLVVERDLSIRALGLPQSRANQT